MDQDELLDAGLAGEPGGLGRGHVAILLGLGPLDLGVEGVAVEPPGAPGQPEQSRAGGLAPGRVGDVRDPRPGVAPGSSTRAKARQGTV